MNEDRTRVALAVHAMNTRFELVLHGGDPVRLRAAGEEALQEIVRLEASLSAFVPTSEIAHINARAAVEPVRVSPEVFGFLLRSAELWRSTDGAFDLTVGPLMRCWGFWGEGGRLADPADVERARELVGFGRIELDAVRRTVRFTRAGMALDPGAIGKGYAIDRAAELLRESGVRSALLHGGTSTVYAIGRLPDGSPWRAALRPPQVSEADVVGPGCEVDVQDEAVSVSTLTEKCFRTSGRTYGHVIDPRTGWPVAETKLSLLVLPSAAEADVWSTALLVLGAEGLGRLRASRSGVRGMVVSAGGAVQSVGMDPGRGSAESV